MTKNIDSLTDPSQLLELAEELEDNDQLTEALQAVEKAIKLDPQNGKAWCSKASILQDMDQPGEAFRVLTQACKDLPNNLDCLFNLGAFLSEHGNVSQACGCFDKINKLDPNYPKIKVHLGNAFLKLALWPQAIECLGEALQTELGPMDKARVLNHIGEAHMNNLDPEKPEENKRELEKAKEYFDQSLELNPDDYIPVGNMAMTFCRLGEPEAALKVLEPALAKFPTQARLYVMQGITLSLIEGRQKEALAAFDKAIELALGHESQRFCRKIAALEHCDEGYGHYAVARGEILAFIDVHLDEDGLIGVFGGDLLQHGSEHLAGAAPRGEEIAHNGLIPF